MNIKVHRGANQIGGCITEISTEGCKIFIDFGSDLPDSQKKELTKAQIENMTAGADAIFYTHYHADHVGLHTLVPDDIPQYIGAGAREVMKCKYAVLNQQASSLLANKMLTYVAGRSIDVGGKGKMMVTPYFVSHSAFDSYMLKICCDGKTILHTGDFRGHGYLGKSLFDMLGKFVKQVDVLITEGTMLGRRSETVVREFDIQRNVIKLLRQHKYVFALCSSTDMERLASLHAACKVTGRVFVVDPYQKSVLNIFTRYSGKYSGLFDFDNAFSLRDYSSKNVKAYLGRAGFLMVVRTSMHDLVKRMMNVYDEEAAWLVYSMWSGYAEKGKDYSLDGVAEMRSLFNGHIADGTKDGFHTSGHADVDTLAKVCATVNPRIGIIPIHKDKETCLAGILDMNAYRVFQTGEYKIRDVDISVLQ